MKLIVGLDDNNGMLFAHRRQSQDRALRADVLARLGEKPLWMSPYSARQFDRDGRLRVDAAFWEKAGEGEWCFVEAPLPDEVWPTAEALVVYRWNRRYPADVRLPFSLSEWNKTESVDFPGFSHEKLTREVYIR